MATARLPSPSMGDGGSEADLVAPRDYVNEAITFLKQKGVFEKNPVLQQLYLDWLCTPMSAGAALAPFFEGAQAWAVALVRPSVSTATSAPAAEVHQFSTDEFPGYTMLRMVNDDMTRVQRRQFSGLCYMHAAVVVQYYAIWHNARRADPSAVSEHGMVDLVQYIREHFTATQLQKHIFEDEGGNSLSFLKAILSPGSLVGATDPSRFAEYLALYGPALVSHFSVYDDFFDSHELHHHHGKPSGSFKGYHAMVLVGVREAPSGGRFFLLQNWWYKKQFVEVSEEYLLSCGAIVSFVLTPQGPGTFAVQHGHWAENECLDKPESLFSEY